MASVGQEWKERGFLKVHVKSNLQVVYVHIRLNVKRSVQHRNEVTHVFQENPSFLQIFLVTAENIMRVWLWDKFCDTNPLSLTAWTPVIFCLLLQDVIAPT